MWNSKSDAEAHYQDLLLVKEHVTKEFEDNRNGGMIVDKAANDYRMDIIDRLIKDSDSERKSKSENKNPGMQ